MPANANPATRRADLNADGRVDKLDLALLLQSFGSVVPDTNLPPANGHGPYKHLCQCTSGVGMWVWFTVNCADWQATFCGGGGAPPTNGDRNNPNGAGPTGSGSTPPGGPNSLGTIGGDLGPGFGGSTNNNNNNNDPPCASTIGGPKAVDPLMSATFSVTNTGGGDVSSIDWSVTTGAALVTVTSGTTSSTFSLKAGADSGVVKLSAMVTADGETCNAEYTFAIIKVNLTAHRPNTEFFDFNTHTVSDDDEETPGAGIRLRSSQTPAGQPSNTSNMIKLTIEPSIDGNPPPGIKFVLRREDESLQAWGFPSAILDGTKFNPGELEHELLVLSLEYNVWIENTITGSSAMVFEARDADTDEVFASDRVVFNTFTSIVIALAGEILIGHGNIGNSGIAPIAQSLYDPANGSPGYDVHFYDEDKVNEIGAGLAFNIVSGSISRRGVKNVALFGHSHGGGSTHDLASLLQTTFPQQGVFSLRFTGYIDAIKNFLDSATAAENRLPPGSMSHLNYWEDITHWPTIIGAPTLLPGPITNIYVNIFSWGANLDHGAIDNNPVVQAGIEAALRSSMPTP